MEKGDKLYGSLQKYENDFSKVCEFSKSQPLILNNTNVLVKRQYFSYLKCHLEGKSSIVLAFAIFQVSLTQKLSNLPMWDGCDDMLQTPSLYRLCAYVIIVFKDIQKRTESRRE